VNDEKQTPLHIVARYVSSPHEIMALVKLATSAANCKGPCQESKDRIELKLLIYTAPTP